MPRDCCIGWDSVAPEGAAGSSASVAIMGKSMVKSEAENVMEAEIGGLAMVIGVFAGMRNLLGVSGIVAAIVGLTSSQVCIWRRSGPRSIFQSSGGTFSHGLCMSYADPEVVIGCEDGRAFVYDMYSRSCSSIHRLHPSPVTCLAVTDDQLIIGGSTFGNVAIADHTSGQRLGLLKSAFAPTVIRCLSYSANSHLIFAGSSSGYAHCWDLRTLRPLWETRVSPNVIYSAHHFPGDTSVLAVGGIDGVLRLVCQKTGDTIRSFIMDTSHPAQSSSRQQVEKNYGRPAESGPRQRVEKKNVREIAPDARLDNIPTNLRPPITGLSVGMRKIVTTHGENYIRVWKFRS